MGYVEFEFGAAGTLTPRLDVMHQSRIYFGANPRNLLTQQAPYSVLNARLTWRAQSMNWTVAAFVTNLTDELCYTGRSDQTNTFGDAFGETGRPREFGLTVKRSF